MRAAAAVSHGPLVEMEEEEEEEDMGGHDMEEGEEEEEMEAAEEQQATGSAGEQDDAAMEDDSGEEPQAGAAAAALAAPHHAVVAPTFATAAEECERLSELGHRLAKAQRALLVAEGKGPGTDLTPFKTRWGPPSSTARQPAECQHGGSSEGTLLLLPNTMLPTPTQLAAPPGPSLDACRSLVESSLAILGLEVALSADTAHSALSAGGQPAGRAPCPTLARLPVQLLN